MNKLDQLISYFGIASGIGPRGLQLVTKETGWQGFVDKYIAPQRAQGIRRFLLWMPFGQEIQYVDGKPTTAGLRTQRVCGQSFASRVRFDAYQLAKQAGLDWVTKGFVEAIRPLVLDGCQVIGYCGALGGAPEFELVSGRDRQRYLADSLEPLRRAGCDIAIDSACLSPSGHYVTPIAYALRTANVRVYCESMPTQLGPHWANGDVISDERQYQVALDPTSRKVLCDPKEITGEIVRGFWMAPPTGMNFVGWYREAIPKVLNEGHSACLHLVGYLREKGEIKDLLGT